jgi:cation transport ATPase
MFTLIAVGVGAAYLYSAIATIFPNLFPDSFKHHGEIDLYFESAAVILCSFYLVSGSSCERGVKPGRPYSLCSGLPPSLLTV